MLEVAGENSSTCELAGTKGVRLNASSCYVVFPGSVIQSRSTWSSGVASWFKANAYCRSVGAQLASLSAAAVDVEDSTPALVDYLTAASATGPFWLGLTRNPWVWVEHYDQGMDRRTAVTYGDGNRSETSATVGRSSSDAEDWTELEPATANLNPSLSD